MLAPATSKTLPVDLTLTLRQPCMLAVMSIPPPTDQVQGPAIGRRPGLGEVESRIRAC